MQSSDPINSLKEQGIGSLKKLKNPELILKARQFLAELAKEDGAALPGSAPIISNEKILDLFFNSLLNFRENTVVQYKKEVKKLLGYLEANNINVSSMRLEHIEAYIVLLKKIRKIGSVSQAKLIYIIRVFLNFLKERGYNDIDPVRLEAPRRNRNDVKRELVTEADFMKLLSIVDSRPEKFKNENITYKIILCLLYCTGIRRSELVGLDWENIYFDQNKIKVLDCKGGKDRLVKISDNLKELLIVYRRALGIYKGPLIRGIQARKRITKTALQNIVKGLFKETKIDRSGLRIHSFRHSYVTNVCRKAGVKVAQESAGHSRIDTTEAYLHTSEEDMDKAIIDIPQRLPSSEESS